LLKLDDFNLTEVSGIKKIYHDTYYEVASQLAEKGMEEIDIKAKYQKVIMYISKLQKSTQFDKNLDVVLYLLTLCLLK